MGMLSVLCLRQQPDEDPLNLPSKKNNPKRAQNQNTREKNTRKQQSDEVRPQCIRPRGNQKRGLLLWKNITMLAASLFSRELQNFSTLNKNLEIPYLYKQISKSESQPAPACRSTGPVDRSQPRVGSLQSVDRAPSLCTLCTSVDRAGRPNY